MASTADLSNVLQTQIQDSAERHNAMGRASLLKEPTATHSSWNLVSAEHIRCGTTDLVHI